MSFRLSAEKYHLTYKTHINMETVIEKIRSVGEFTCYSIVHENGDENEENPTPYAHTHVAVKYRKKLDSINTKLFDIGEIHPNIQTKRSIKWFAHILDQYHKGYKTKKDGKKYFIEPVGLKQYGTERILGEETLFEAIAGAPSLIDACIITGIQPKSIADVNLLRNESRKRKRIEVEESVDIKKFKEYEYDKKKSLVLKGPPALGKTNWAISRFNHPLLITDIDDLRDITKETDGLVFDEMIFTKYDKEKQVYLTDMAFSRTIRTRHSNATIPKLMPRIFLCNEDEYVFGIEPHEAVKRRYNELIVEEVMFE